MRTAVLLLLAVGATTAQANRYEVTSLANSGDRTLRWAIARANERVGADKIIFDGALSGGSIRPKAPLPEVTDRLTIDGDINDDGKPDIVLSGADCSGTEGLSLRSDYNVIRGLCVSKWSRTGLHVCAGSDRNQILGCYFGTDLAGTARRYNTLDDIYLEGSLYNTIGGHSEAERNVFACGSYTGRHGVLAEGGGSDSIFGNYFGVGSDGLTAIGSGYSAGLELEGWSSSCYGNYIGGATPETRNVFGNLYYGIALDGPGATGNYIVGNYVGLAADGDTPAPCEDGVSLYYAVDNQIGGENPGQRNVISSCGSRGISSFWAEGNRIEGNYIGLNAAGTAARAQPLGVLLSDTSTGTTIGSSAAAGGNCFATGAAEGESANRAIELLRGGTGVVVRNNHFGVKPGGGSAQLEQAIWVNETPVKIKGNELVGSTEAAITVGCFSDETEPVVTGNTFRDCGIGVSIVEDATASLGDLGNASSQDDGGNLFDPSNVWHIMNYSVLDIKAEGNDFGTTSRAAINADIWDMDDDPSLGRVDFDPLIGGVHPTAAGPLAVAGPWAASTRAGAQVVFSLSAAASVEARVLNIAGRPVRALCRGRECPAGRSTMLWDGQTDAGVVAPRGAYLVEVVARSRDGGQCRAMTPLRLER
jgi:FlgD Ig-like domain